MSDFRAKIIAELDTSQVESKIKGLGKTQVRLSNFTLNTSGLASKIQKALNGTPFTITIQNVKTANLTGQLSALGTEMGTKVSTSMVNSINQKIANGGIEAAISRVQQKFSALQTTMNGLSGGGTEELHSKMNLIETDLEHLNTLEKEFANTGSMSAEQLVQHFRDYSNTLQRVNNNITTVTNSTRQFASQVEVATLKNRMETWLQNNTRATKAYGGQVQSYLQQLNQLSAQGGVAKGKLQELANSFKMVDAAAGSAGLKGKSFASSISGAFQSITRYIGVSTLLYSSFNAIRNGIKDIVALDTALVDLQKTTSATSAQLKEFYFDANDTAKALGSTTEEVIQAAADWSRLGYSIEDAKTMAEVSSIFASISPGMDIETSTDGLVSAMKAFNIEADDALDGIASKINAIGNSQAVSNEDIVNFLTRSSSAMHEANNTLEETIALGTAATEITRNADSVGNALKTVSMRIRGYDEETEEYVGGLESLSGDIADLTKSVEHPLGVSLFKDDAKTEFKSTTELLRDISEVYDELTDKQQANLLEKLAGKRQGQIVAAILNNFDAVESSLDTMTNSAGSAMREMEIIQNSLEYKLNALKETAVGIFQNLFQTDQMGVVIDTLTGVLNVVDFLTEHLGLLGTAIVGLSIAEFIKNFDQLRILGLEGATSLELMRTATANMAAQDVIAAVAKSNLTAAEAGLLLAEHGVTQEQILQAASAGLLSKEQTLLLLTASGLEAEEAGLIVTTLAEAGAFTTAAGSAGLFGGVLTSLKLIAKGLKAELAKLWATMMANPVILVIAGIAAAAAAGIAIYDALTVSYEEAKEELQDLKSEYSNNEQELTSLNGELETTKSRIDELKGKGKLSFTEQEELDRLIRQNDELQREIDLLNNEQKIKKKEINKTFTDAMDKGYGDTYYANGQSLGSGSSQIDTFFQYYESYTTGAFKDQKNAAEEADSYLKAIQSRIDEMRELADGVEYIQNPTTEDEKKVNQWLDYIGDLEDRYAIVTGGDHAKSNAFNRLTSHEFDEATKDLKELGKQGKVTAEQLKDPKYSEFVNKLIEIGVIADDSDKSLAFIAQGFNDASGALDGAADSAGNAADKVEESSKRVTSAADQVKTAVEGLNKVKDIINSQSTGNSLSVEDFNSDELKDYTSALEYHNGTLQLNREKVQELAEAKTKEELATIAANKAQSQSDYLKNAGEIEQLRQKIRDKNYAEGETESTVQASINSLLAENEALANDCTAFDLMSASLREATDAYHNWLNAQNASESGDMFDDTVKAINHINDTLNNSESEYFGRIGRTDYKAAVDLIVPESVDSEDQEKVNKYLDSIHNLFTYDDKGNRQGLNIEQFCKDAVDKGLMVLDESGENYEIAGQKTMEDFAKGMNLSLPLVQAMFGEMEEFGGEFDWSDEAVKSIGDLGVAANESAEKLRNLKGNEDLKIKMDVEGIEDVDEKVKVLDGTIKEMQDFKAKPGVDSSQIEHANNVLDYCIAQKQNIEKPIVMNVNTSKLDSKTADAISKIQQFKDAANEVQKLKLKGLDTSEAQKNVNNLANEIKGIDPTIQAALKLDTNSVSALETSINKVTGDQLVSIGIDDSAIVGWTADTKQATVKYNKDTTEIDAYKPKDQTATVTYHKLSSEVDNYNPKNLTRTVTYKKKVESVHGLNGTAHLQGTANAYGNWGAKNGGNTLVGELGREIVVDPHTGKWYTVGDTGAEFVTIPQGAIVFNHKQTESLLANGYVAGRASALVNGTAGKAMVRGGISVQQAKVSTYSSGYTNTDTSSSKNSTTTKKHDNKTKDKGKNALEKFQDWISKFFDWIEIRLERQTDRIEKYVKRADRAIDRGHYDYANKQYANAMYETKVQIGNEQQASNKYNKQANKVINRAMKKGLLGKGKKAKRLKKEIISGVKNGSIDISKYNEKTQEVIKAYQEWYNKSYEAQQAIEDLQADLEEYSRKMIENIAQKYDDKDEATNTQLDLLEQRSKNAKSASKKNDYLKQAAKKYDTILANDDNEINEYKGIIKDNKKIINKDNKKLRGSAYKKLSKKGKKNVDKLIDSVQKTVKSGKALSSSTLDKLADYYAKGYIKGTFYDACIRYNDALDAKKEAETQKEIDAETAKAEKAALGAQMIENIEQEYENKDKAIERTTREKKTAQDLKKARRQDLTQQDYNDLINQSKLRQANYAAEAAAIQKQIDDNLASGLWTESSQEYLDAIQKVADYEDEVQQCLIEQEELKVSLRDDVYWRTYERAHDAAKRLANVLKGINDLIDDNMLFNSDNKLTEFGIPQLSLLTKEYENASKQVQNYTDDINNLNNLYQQGEYTEQEYIEKLGELEEGVLSSASSMKSSLNSILKIYQDIEKNELDGLFKVIEARKKALTAKKAYYDYDKTLKSKNKDIQFLQAQLDALQGVEGLEARAKRAKLEAELAEKQEDLNDTIQEHQLSLSQDALDGLKDSLQEAFDDRWKDIYSDLHAIKELMDESQKLVGDSSTDIAKALGELFGLYGINADAQAAINGTITRQGYASGTKSVPRDMLAWTNENRKNEIIVRKSDGAILTPLSKGDSVIPNDFAERLYQWGKLTPHTLIKEIGNSQLSRVMPQVPEFNITQHYDSLLNVEGNVDSTVISDLEKFARQFYRGAYEYTTKEIARDARKIGIK